MFSKSWLSCIKAPHTSLYIVHLVLEWLNKKFPKINQYRVLVGLTQTDQVTNFVSDHILAWNTTQILNSTMWFQYPTLILRPRVKRVKKTSVIFAVSLQLSKKKKKKQNNHRRCTNKPSESALPIQPGSRQPSEQVHDLVYYGEV